MASISAALSRMKGWISRMAEPFAVVIVQSACQSPSTSSVPLRELAAVQQQFPGLVFRLGGPVDAHHNQARFTWHLGAADGEPLVIGFDVAVVNSGGQIRSVHGFLDKVPAAA